ncbi:MAG: glycosyltransferase [Gemmatimonadaceae bacterium]|nr:glycosyltransferase [Gemmatimonadaceae bacterium]
MSELLELVLPTFITWSEQFVLVFFLLINLGYGTLLLLAVPEIWSHWHIADDEGVKRVLAGDALPPLTMLVPAHNEEVSIVSSVLSFLTLEYPSHEVVVVNDGSTDATVARLIEAYDLYEVPPAFSMRIPTAEIRAVYRSRTHAKLLVVDKANGGKADALNCAINCARFPFVIAVDADTLVEPDALQRLARPFLLGESVAAVGGTIRVVNACRVEQGRVVDARVDSRFLPAVQVVEYLRAFLFGRLGWNRLGGSLIISGAFGLFRRSYLLDIKGYQTGNVTEDMDLVVRLRRYLYDNKIRATIPFVPDPVAWTEVPISLKVLARQRERWHRGLILGLLQHRDLFFNAKYGVMGLLVYPFFVLEAIAPLIELLGVGLVALSLLSGSFDPVFAQVFLLVAYLFGVLLSVWAVMLEEFTFRRYPHRSDFWRMMLLAVAEGFVYRFATVGFRLHAFWKVLRRDDTWGRMIREGYAAAPRVTKSPGGR